MRSSNHHKSTSIALILVLVCSLHPISGFGFGSNVRSKVQQGASPVLDQRAHNLFLYHRSSIRTTAFRASQVSNDELNGCNNSSLFGGVRKRTSRVVQKFSKIFRTLALALMLFLGTSSNSMYIPDAHAASATTAAVTASSKSGIDNIPGAKAYIQKFLFNSDEYSLFDTAMREPDGQAIDAIPGMVDSSMGQPLSTGFGKEVQKQSGGMAALQILKSVVGLAIVFGALPLTLILATQGWKFITDFGERITYGKDKSVGKDTYSAYDATEKDPDELDEDGDDEDWDPDNPSE